MSRNTKKHEPATVRSVPQVVEQWKIFQLRDQWTAVYYRTRTGEIEAVEFMEPRPLSLDEARRRIPYPFVPRNRIPGDPTNMVEAWEKVQALRVAPWTRGRTGIKTPGKAKGKAVKA